MNFHIIKHIAVRVFCWILLLQLINISIDAPDLIPATATSQYEDEDLSINDIESIYELISEIVFDVDVPEGDENDIDKKFPIFEAYCFPQQPGIRHIAPDILRYESHYLSNLIFKSSEPDFPPPKRRFIL
jgi:hypothetical protein